VPDSCWLTSAFLLNALFHGLGRRHAALHMRLLARAGMACKHPVFAVEWLLAIGFGLLPILATWLVAPGKVRAVGGRAGRFVAGP